MESQYIGSNSNSRGVDHQKEKEVKVANKRTIGSCESLLRILALVFTLTAAVVLGRSEQTKIVSLKIVPTLPPIDIPATAKWHYLSAFVYFVAANAIACAYAAFSLVLSFANRAAKSNLGLLILVLDLMMVALLFSSIGAAGAIGLMGFQGNSHVQWSKVCNVFGKFCHQVAASAVLSMLGSLTFVFLVVLAAIGLHRRSN